MQNNHRVTNQLQFVVVVVVIIIIIIIIIIKRYNENNGSCRSSCNQQKAHFVPLQIPCNTIKLVQFIPTPVHVLQDIFHPF